jgi:prepilin-type N-terminal cleavage/methylation domain-containing protein
MFKKGFTLIELLVVIAIIAIITSIGVANLITAQKQARDSARREIISNVGSAFEQYYAETGAYPVGNQASAFENGVAPTDPKDPTTTITWNIDDDSYCVCATLESSTGNASAPVGNSTTCNWSSTGTYYCVQNKQ